MKDYGIVVANSNSEYCKDISVDIANKSGTKHINLKDIYTVAELDDFSGKDTRAMGEKVGLIIIKTTLEESKKIYNTIKENSEIELGKVTVTFYIQNEETKAFENNVVELDSYCCFRSIERLYLGPDTVSIAIKLSASEYK